jgi:hypothetical protein
VGFREAQTKNSEASPTGDERRLGATLSVFDDNPELIFEVVDGVIFDDWHADFERHHEIDFP